MNGVRYRYIHIGRELPSTLLRRSGTMIAWNRWHFTSCNSHIDPVSDQVWLHMHVRKPATQSLFWSPAFELGAILWDDSSTNLFLNYRITPKPRILWLTYIWRIRVSKIIPILSIIMMVLGYFNSHLLPAAKGQSQEFNSANTLHGLCHTL